MPKILLLIFTCLLTTVFSAEKPNILFFLVDDMGWQDTSLPFHDKVTELNKSYETPEMEKLAKDGIMFTNAYAHAVCSPSRISLMTGASASRHMVTCWTLNKGKSPERGNKKFKRAQWNLNGLQPIGSNIENSYEAVTLPQLLQKQGYHTIHVGKGHFGASETPGANPLNLGFDVNVAGTHMGGPGNFYGDQNFGNIGNKPRWSVKGLEQYHGQKINLTEACTLEAIKEVKKAVGMKKPFYLYMSHYTVHAPWQADRRFLEKFKKKGFKGNKLALATMLAGMDKSLGDLRACLDELGVADNTLIVFMSDNGAPRQVPLNKPLRGYKITAYEGGSRVPMLVYWAGKTAKNARSKSPIIIDDIFPSFLEAAGLKDIPKNDGKSFLSLLDNSKAKDRPLFWHYPNFYDVPPFSSVRYKGWKLIYRHTTQKFELYNLKNDISETKDLSSSNPEQLSFLVKVLSKHLRETGARFPIDKKTNKEVPFPDEAI